MDTGRIAALVREIARTPSRRAVTRALAGLGVSSVLGPLIGPGTDQASGKGHGHNKNNKKKKKKDKKDPPPRPNCGAVPCYAGTHCCFDSYCCPDGSGCDPGPERCCSPSRTCNGQCCDTPCDTSVSPFACCPPERVNYSTNPPSCCDPERSCGEVCCVGEETCLQSEIPVGEGVCCPPERACGFICCDDPRQECCPVGGFGSGERFCCSLGRVCAYSPSGELSCCLPDHKACDGGGCCKQIDVCCRTSGGQHYCCDGERHLTCLGPDSPTCQRA
jgi:hypothetical protein